MTFDPAYFAFCLLILSNITTFVLLLKKTFEPKDDPVRQKSVELSEFLKDIERHGYGFVRVDPGCVFYRRPTKE